MHSVSLYLAFLLLIQQIPYSARHESKTCVFMASVSTKKSQITI